MCSGECVSASATKEGKIRKECSCCSAVEVATRKHTIELVKECACNSTKCEEQDSLMDQAMDMAGDVMGGAMGVADDVLDAAVDAVGDVVEDAGGVLDAVFSFFG